MPARGIIPAMSLDSASSQQSAPAYRPTATVQAIGSRWAVAAGHPLAAELPRASRWASSIPIW